MVCTPLPCNCCGQPFPEVFWLREMVFPECSLLPHAGTITLCRMQKQAGSKQGAVCFSPSSWQGASQPKHTQISRRGLDLSALLHSLQDKLPPCSLHHAQSSGKPLRWLQALPRLLQRFC